MKSIFAKMSLILSLSLAVAAAQAAPTLKDNMKALGGLMKQISVSVKDPSKNPQSAQIAQQLIELFQAVLVQVPEAIGDLPADQQPAALAQYQTLIQNEISEATALKEALLKNDNATAVSLLAQMNATKKEGHSQFNP